METWNPCDAILIAALLCKKVIVEDFSCIAIVDIRQSETRAQMIVSNSNSNGNIRVITQVDVEAFKAIAQWGAGCPGTKIDDL